MRLLKLGVYHPVYVRDFYARNRDLKTRSYSIQHAALINDRFGSSDFWTKALTEIGYETCDLIANAESLQKRWARENDFAFDENNWLFDIAAAQIKKFRPEILLVADYTTFTHEFLRNIRRECSSIRLILGWCGAPYSDASVFREWDVALSCVPEMVADFRAQGLRSFHVNHAFAPPILQQINTASAPTADFAFIGSVVKQNQFHLERERLLQHLIAQTDLQIWADIKRSSIVEPRNLLARAVGKLTRRNHVSVAESDFERRAHPPLFGLEMFQQLQRSRVVFNNHIDISPVSASNMRLFETTGIGACLLTDWKANLPDLFEPDREVLTYRTAAELVEKVNYILAHEPERRQIARAGQRRTLRDHTFEQRAARIDEIIRSVTKKDKG